MLSSETKRRIDSCRDILVGQLPLPTDQVELITLALIYKFMDDLDEQSVQLGGKRSFFIKDLADFRWRSLMPQTVSAADRVRLFADGLEALGDPKTGKHLPEMFRDIFRNAMLKFRDGRILSLFLTELDGFAYSHSEELGNAFEYLLQSMGAQGDNGQFRTPRHIIDFIVEVLEPKPEDKILDPACGTGGFLVSAYKHILGKHTSKGSSVPGDQLSPAKKEKLTQQLNGYDITPMMVKLSKVNMFLHGFSDPQIHEYDTLSNDARWNEKYDLIMANPPFMTPKGGVVPHTKFRIAAKKAEVLFTDYIAEHLTTNGRAGIIVPEGIIFQSGTAYKALRKFLVEDSLVAVISLPAGVFNPYSGVKTSILILDKGLARQSDSIAFFKVENDGYDLGAQRRPIDKNDLPKLTKETHEYLEKLRAGKKASETENIQIVPKEKIAANGEYNLGGDRYREGPARNQAKHPFRKLADLCKIKTGKKDVNSGNPNGKYPFFTCAKEHTYTDEYSFDTEAILVAGNGDVGACQYYKGKFEAYQRTYVLTDWNEVDSKYLYNNLRAFLPKTVNALKQGNTMPYIKLGMLADFEIPLPPLEEQKEIVAEIEGFQKVIDGARAVVENYKPQIPIDPEWPVVRLGDIVDDLESGVSVNSNSDQASNGTIGILKTSCVTTGVFRPEENKTVLKDELARVRCPVRENTIIISRMNTEALVGANAYIANAYPNLYLPDRLWQAVISRPDVEVRFIHAVLASEVYRKRISANCGGTSGSMKNITKPQLLAITVPLPPLAMQKNICAEIETEQAMVNANKELIVRFEKKIQAVMDRVWGGGTVE